MSLAAIIFFGSIILIPALIRIFVPSPSPEIELTPMVNCKWCGDYAEGSGDFCIRCMYYNFPEEMKNQ